MSPSSGSRLTSAQRHISVQKQQMLDVDWRTAGGAHTYLTILHLGGVFGDVCVGGTFAMPEVLHWGTTPKVLH